MSILEPHSDKLQYIFDNARVGIAICNAKDNTLEMVNPAFAAIHGYEPHELIGASPGEVFAPECMLRIEEHENTSTCAINDVSFETTHIRKDGSLVPVSVHITVIKDDNGIIKQRIANIQDISDRKQTESELRITHERFTQIYDNSSDVIYLIEVTPEGRFIHLDINPAYAEVTGVAREEIIGRYVDEFENEAFRTILLEKYSACLTAGEKTDYINDYPLLSGSKTFHSRLTPLFDKQGRIHQIVGIARDITHQKNSEIQLRQAIEFNNEIINTIPDLLFELDAEGTYLTIWAQDERLLAEQKAILIGNNVRDILPPDAVEVTFNTMKEVDETGQSLGNTMCIDLPEGRKWFELSVSKKKSSGTYIALSRDITERKEQELQLHKTKANLSAVISTIPDLVWVKDGSGVYMMCNTAFGNFFGAECSDIVGKTDYDFITREQADFFRQKDREALASGKICINEEEITFAWGGQNAIMETRKVPIYDGEKFIGVLGIGRDITERKEAQDALKKQEQEFRNLSENSPNIIIRYDRDGRQIYVNQAYAYQIGTTVEQAINTKPEEEWDTHLYLINMNVQEYQERIKRVIENGEADYFTIAWYRLSDGAYVVHEFYVTVEYDVEGNSIGALAIGHDITEQKQIQQQLEIKEKEFRSLVENTPDNIARWDTQGRYLYINPVHERTLGKSAAEIIGTYIPDQHNAVRIAIAQVVVTGKPITVSQTVVMKDGSIEYHDVSLVPERDMSGNIVTILGIGRDITERKKMELEIAKQKDFQQTLLLGIAEAGLGVHVIEEGRYIYTNDIEKAKKYGYDETFRDIKPKFIETIHPDDREKALDMYTRRLRGEDVPSTYELGVIQSDGVRREHSVSVIVIPNTDPVQTIVVTQDITERKMMEEMMIQKESRLKEAQKIAKVGSWELEFPGLNLSWSDEIFRIFEIDPNSFQPSYDYFLNTIHPEDRHYIDTVFADSLKNKIPYDVVHRFLMRGGEIKYVHERGETLFDEEGNPIRSVGTVQDITERKSIEKKIEHMAHHDALTGLPNRTLAKARAEQIIAHAKRTKSKAAFLFIDLDGFKAINDTLGHSAGDLMLKTVASRLKECVRESDVISRQGGDEFLLILSDLKEENVIASTTQKVLSELEKSFKINDYTLSLSGSIGIALYPDHGDTFELLLQSADTAMYKAKETGKNGYHFYTHQMTHTLIGQFKIQNDLKSALENNEFVLFYQPQIDLGTNRISGVEALIRWEHPIMGMIPPMSFIPVAEKSGLIIPIGQWVIEEACRQAALWEEMGIDLCVAVNISAMQFKRGNLEEIVKNALHTSRINPNRLELELTESIIMHDADNALQSVRNLKALGVQLSIDDFGTGYSSLSYLKRFAVDKLKIDQSFVRDILQDNDDAAIVKTIIQMAKSLNLKTIAEGVEDANVLAVIDAYGCDEVQGYHFAKPMRASELALYHTNFYNSES